MPVLHATCEYKRVGRCSIQADLYLPAAAHPPVILYLHGGALISGTRNRRIAHRVKLYTQAGFAFVSADYRLAPETKLPEIVADIQDAWQWVMSEAATLFNLDAERVAVMGNSAGGYLSLLCGTFARKPKAIVAFYGYGDILGEWYGQPSDYYCRQFPPIHKAKAEACVGKRERSGGGRQRFHYYFYCRQQGSWAEMVSGYSPQHERDKLLAFCPAYLVQPDFPPTMLLHGDADTDVPYEQSVQMAAALAACGVEHELVTIPGGDHGFDANTKDPVVKAALDRSVQFLKRYLAVEG
jgi:acetyl esterase/lipase